MSSVERVNEFTDLKQVTADYIWDNIDAHYNCVDTLPCYISEDEYLIINPAYDALFADEDNCGSCWCFEWAVTDDNDLTVMEFIAEYDLGSPWQAFREAIRLRDEYLAGTIDRKHII